MEAARRVPSGGSVGRWCGGFVSGRRGCVSSRRQAECRLYATAGRFLLAVGALHVGPHCSGRVVSTGG